MTDGDQSVGGARPDFEARLPATALGPGSRKSAASAGSGGGAGAAGSPEVRRWLWVQSGPLPGPAAEVRSIPALRAWLLWRGPGLCSPARPLSRCSRPCSCSTSCRWTQVAGRGRSSGRGAPPKAARAEPGGRARGAVRPACDRGLGGAEEGFTCGPQHSRLRVGS